MRRWLLLALLLLAAPASGASAPSVLGSDGEIYRVLRGEHRELLPGAQAATATNPVLVLEIARVDGAVERLLVPGSDNEPVENYPALALDRTTNTVFVLWEAQFTIHSTLHLTAFTGGEWAEIFELSGDAFSVKLNPRLAATTDRYQRVDASGAVTTATRTVLHLVWWDEGVLGGRALYAALRVEDGRFVPEWQVLSLPDLLPPDASSSSVVLPPDLYRSPQVRATSDGGSALLVFAEPSAGRLGAVHIRPISGSLIHLAEQARVQIIDIGRTTGDRRVLAEKARVQIIDIGRRLMDGHVAEFLASRCAELVAGADPLESVESVAEEARIQIIDIGAQLASGPRVISDKARVQIIDIGRDSANRESSSLASLKVGSVRPAPEALPGNAQLLVSDDGEDLVVAWDADSAVQYRQADAAGWSEARALALDQQLTRDEAYQLLVSRLGQR